MPVSVEDAFESVRQGRRGFDTAICSDDNATCVRCDSTAVGRCGMDVNRRRWLAETVAPAGIATGQNALAFDTSVPQHRNRIAVSTDSYRRSHESSPVEPLQVESEKWA